MREIKDSGIEWIGEIPKEWEINKIKYMFSNGKGLPITKENLIDEGLPVISYGQIHSKDNNGTKIGKNLLRFVNEKYSMKYPQCSISENDFVFADTSEDYDGCGNCVLKRDNSKVFAGYHTIILHSLLKRDNRFLAYLFKTDTWRKQIREKASGVKVFSITQKTLMNCKVILPGYNEEKIIADYLDTKCSEIDATAEDIQKEISLLEDYKKSVITEAVTKGLNPDAEMKDSGIGWIGDIPKDWEIIRIKNIGEYRNGLTYKPTDITDENTGILVLRSSNIQAGKISLKDNVYVSTFVRNDLKVQKGDILICSRNGSRELVGKNAIIEDLQDVTFGAFMMIFRCDSPKYLYYILNSKVFSYYLGSFFTSTINQLTGSNFGNMKIVYVSNKLEQNKIVSYLDSKCSEIDAIIADKKRQLDILAEYKKSLIYEYVTGKKEVPVHE